MYVNQFDKNSECALRGKSAEDLFELFLKKSKKKYRPATLPEGMIIIMRKKLMEIVTWLLMLTTLIGCTKNSEVSSENAEKNVNGNKGWLYGENDLLAFYRNSDSSFYVVRTKDLAELCEKICDNKRVFYPSEALYHRYTRSGRKDVLSMIKFEDLLKIKYNKISLRRKDVTQ